MITITDEEARAIKWAVARMDSEFDSIVAYAKQMSCSGEDRPDYGHVIERMVETLRKLEEKL